MQLALHDGEEMKQGFIRAHHPGPKVLIFALDGVGHEQMMAALQHGQSPRIASLLGARQKNGNYAHAYIVPDAVSILPSTTVPAWTSVFTGQGPAHTGVPGNEWFERENMRFIAPAPVSVEETDDILQALVDDLVGKAIKGLTLFERINGPAFVSLNYVHRGADLYISESPSVIAQYVMEYDAGKLMNSLKMRQDSYTRVDQSSAPKVIAALQKHGVPSLQVVYFPGTDLYTHIAEDSLHEQIRYLQEVSFPLIDQVLEEYQRQGMLDDTYVVFISDHGHTPVLMDTRHALAANPEMRAPGLLNTLGFRVRPNHLEVSAGQSDFQAVLAYQGAMAYVYLADRSTCPNAGERCSWSLPPRFKQDVMPVARAFYQANRGDKNFPELKGVLDLVFARRPVPPGQNTHEYEIYDGKRLVPINRYLKRHPRPDLVQLERRMHWLSAGPYGHLAGDVLLLTKTGLERPIEQRFYFSPSYHSQHGSASVQDSLITLIIARQNLGGEAIRQAVSKILGSQPSQLDFTPLVRNLLMQRTTGNLATP